MLAPVAAVAVAFIVGRGAVVQRRRVRWTGVGAG